jgi:integrase
MIQKAKQRAKLAPRREPYFTTLGKGRDVGFRRTDDGGTWIARLYDPATRKRTYKALGEFDGVAGDDVFGVASAAALAWFAFVEAGGETKSEVKYVREVCAAYVSWLRTEKRDATADDAEARFRLLVDNDPLGKTEFAKTNKTHFTKWRERLLTGKRVEAKRGARCRSKKPQPDRTRTPATCNRYMTALRAACNYGKDSLSLVTTDAAWLMPLKEIANANRSRKLDLTPDQRRKFIDAIPVELRAFVTVLAKLPLRPGTLARLTDRDFDSRSRVLTIPERDSEGHPMDKGHGARAFTVPVDVAALFRDNITKARFRQREPGPVLLCGRSNGQPWTKDEWKGPVKKAVRAAGLPEAATIYTLRHAAISDLVSDGLNIHAVAKIAGTSAAMIEKTYGHLRQKEVADALAKASNRI